MTRFSLSKREEDWKKKIITPRVAVCGLVESLDRKSLIIVKRKFLPYGLAFPGGMLEIGETATAAAKREVLEETGIDADVISLLGVQSDPNHDPRWHVVVIYVLMRVKEDKDPKGMDDALEAFWMPYNSKEYSKDFVDSSITALNDYKKWREKEGDLPKLR